MVENRSQSVKRKQALLRNSLPVDEFEAKCTGLGPEFHSFPILNAALQLLKDGCVVFLVSCDHVIDDVS